MSRWLDGPEWVFLASKCVGEAYCCIKISLNSETLRLVLSIFLTHFHLLIRFKYIESNRRGSQP